MAINSSDWSEVTPGAPQGRILEPLLFLVYINDFPFVVVVIVESLLMTVLDCANLQTYLHSAYHWCNSGLLL